MTSLSSEWAAIFSILALMLGYVVGQAMDSLIGRQGFGVGGNMIILAGGFYIGLRIGEGYHIDFSTPESAMAIGICGAFVSLFALALAKRLLLR
jgi:hypothetical protein